MALGGLARRKGFENPAHDVRFVLIDLSFSGCQFSLYEVSDVQPGTSMVLRDHLSDAASVTVREKSATRTLKQWDRIAVRVVPERDHYVISGALLPFRPEAVDFLFAGQRDALKLRKRDALRLTREQLMGCAPVFTSAWLFIEIDRAMTPAHPQFPIRTAMMGCSTICGSRSPAE